MDDYKKTVQVTIKRRRQGAIITHLPFSAVTNAGLLNVFDAANDMGD